MSDNEDKKQEELKKIENDLRNVGLSRRNFLNRLSAAGVTFGAAVALGLRDAQAGTQSDASVNVTSTNPAVDNILTERQGVEAPNSDKESDSLRAMAQYGRYFRYHRYFRYFRYQRYNRYCRYARFYSRFF